MCVGMCFICISFYYICIGSQRPLAFLGNEKNKVKNIVKQKARKKLYQIQLAELFIIFVQSI